MGQSIQGAGIAFRLQRRFEAPREARWDEPGVNRNRYRLLTEIAERLDYDVAGLDAIELPHDDLPRSGIERIDPVTRSVVPKIYNHKQATVPPRIRP